MAKVEPEVKVEPVAKVEPEVKAEPVVTVEPTTVESPAEPDVIPTVEPTGDGHHGEEPPTAIPEVNPDPPRTRTRKVYPERTRFSTKIRGKTTPHAVF